MHIQSFLCGISLLSLTTAHKGHRRRSIPSSSEALNQTLTNIVPNAAGGPTLYYNGSGPVPSYNETSPTPAPLPTLGQQEAEDNIFNEILAIANGNGLTTDCSKCIAGTEVMHLAAITQPVSTIVNLLIRACEAFPKVYDSIYAQTCYEQYAGIGGTGPYLAQLFARMSMATNDMQGYCFYVWDTCSQPPTMPINESAYFKPKPANKTIAPSPSNETINVLHLSDWHLDPRYDIGSEANCSQYLCCRPYSTNTDLNTTSINPSIQASRFGYFYCDSPPDLALSAFSTMDQFINKSSISFTIFTGDIVSHDNDDQISRAYVEYEEMVTYQTFKAQMKNSPIYATLGNHDSLPEAFNSPNSINNSTGQTNAFSWNYNLLSSMWLDNGWIDGTTAQYAANHYGAYATVTSQGLKIISINTDFWYTDNIFNYYNMTNPDNSGILTFLANELQKSEDIDQRVWIIGHVIPGYDGDNALPNPTALFYSIVARFSPSTIAGIFFGHTHEDQLMIYYDYLPNSTISNNSSVIRNTTLVDYNKPLQVAYIGPSITPLTGNNAGWVNLEVDAVTFSVVNYQTYFANMSNANSWTTPIWEFEYDARQIYDPNTTLSATAPLDGAFWHGVTENMLANNTIVEVYNFLETKSSDMTETCSTAACARQKVCYIRSGSAALGYACPYTDGPF
ncbi:Ser Thr phosphatase family protein [Rutstroemia sp. NJR-2017a WRK4]|nr:Ser Thr phosphatase family protein [Rutstroemia sp. NJR-2017a WRK4]